MKTIKFKTCCRVRKLRVNAWIDNIKKKKSTKELDQLLRNIALKISVRIRPKLKRSYTPELLWIGNLTYIDWNTMVFGTKRFAKDEAKGWFENQTVYRCKIFIHLN